MLKYSEFLVNMSCVVCCFPGDMWKIVEQYSQKVSRSTSLDLPDGGLFGYIRSTYAPLPPHPWDHLPTILRFIIIIIIIIIITIILFEYNVLGVSNIRE